MRQADLFSSSESELQVFDVPNAELWLKRDLLRSDEAWSVFDELHSGSPWEQETITMYGRELLSPRLTAWYGDSGCEYAYSKIVHTPLPWTAALQSLKERVEEATAARFNSALLNLYRDGNDSVAWHSDDEPELGTQPRIASLSLGVERVFQLKHKSRKDIPRLDIRLTHGSLLWMGGACQSSWLHQLPKRKGVSQPRINVTWRWVD